jgi:hypothetical protein
MINFSKQVPSIYTNASRDFQFIEQLIDIVLNSVKHDIDSIYALPVSTYDAKITELLALTLGFKVKRNYDKNQLAALVGVLPSILKYKGTIRAITLAAEVLIKASGTTGDFSCTVNNAHLEVILPEDLLDVTLFSDLLDYILPAGMTCRIIRETREQLPLTDEDKILVGISANPVRFKVSEDLAWDSKNESTGLSSLYAFDQIIPEFAANIINEDTVNAGLLSNTVIPVLDDEVPTESPTPGESEDVLSSNMVDKDGNILISSDGYVLNGKVTG